MEWHVISLLYCVRFASITISISVNNIKHIIILKFLFVGWVELKTLTLTNNMILCSIICLFLCLFFPCLGIFIKRPRFPKWQKFLFFLSSEAIFLLFFFFITRNCALSIIWETAIIVLQMLMCAQMLDNKKKKPLYANKNYKKDKKILPTNNLKR